MSKFESKSSAVQVTDSEDIAQMLVAKMREFLARRMTTDAAAQRYARLMRGDLSLFEAEHDAATFEMQVVLGLTAEGMEADAKVMAEVKEHETYMDECTARVEEAAAKQATLEAAKKDMEHDAYQRDFRILFDQIMSNNRSKQSSTIEIRNLKRANPRLFGAAPPPVTMQPRSQSSTQLEPRTSPRAPTDYAVH